MNPSENNLRIDYVEFATRDLPASRAFFQAAFGWSFTDYGPDYTCFADGRLNGGLCAPQITTAKANPLIVIYALDLEKAERAVVQAGGKITMPATEFPGGRRFHFTDPAGLELAVWSDRRPDGTLIT